MPTFLLGEATTPQSDFMHTYAPIFSWQTWKQIIMGNIIFIIKERDIR